MSLWHRPRTHIKAVFTSGPKKIVINLRSGLTEVKDAAVLESVAVTTGTKIHWHTTLEFPCLRIVKRPMNTCRSFSQVRSTFDSVLASGIMFMPTQISRFQNLAIVTHNMNEAAVQGQEGGIDVSRSGKDHIKTSLAPGGYRDLRD